MRTQAYVGRSQIGTALAELLLAIGFTLVFGAVAAIALIAGVSYPLPASAAVMPYPQATTAMKDQPNISGLWVVKEFAFSALPSAKRRLMTAEGQPLPLQPWAKTLYDKRAEDADAGNPYADTASQCLPNGMPLMMYDAPYPIQIIQSPRQVTILFEEESTYRIIYLDEKPPEDPDPTYGGHSVGHFEGDTLVVETNGLVGDTTIDTMGLPHSEKLHLTEHIRRLQPDLLEDIITLDDPGAYTRPWNLRRTYSLWPIDKKIAEYVCNQNQRNSPTGNGHSAFGK